MDDERARFNKALREVDFAFQFHICARGYHGLCKESECCLMVIKPSATYSAMQTCLIEDSTRAGVATEQDLEKVGGVEWSKHSTKPTFEQYMCIVDAHVDRLLVASEDPLNVSPGIGATQLLRLAGKLAPGVPLGGALIVYLHSRGFEVGLNFSLPRLLGFAVVQLYVENFVRAHLRGLSVQETMERGAKRIREE